jgi:chemotaxis protein MotB
MNKLMIKCQPMMLKDLQSQHAGTGGWQIVYTGFILILLCFFIMLTSFASLEDSKITRFVNSFSDAVSVFSGGRSLESGETMIDADTSVVSKEDRIAQLFEKVKMIGEQHGLNHISLRRSERGVIMTLADKTLFDSGNAALSTSSYALLNKISAMINNMDVLVDIEGHTDDRPIRTDAYPSNWELSTARAVNVLRYLIAEGKVKSERLSAVGLSKYHPMVPNTTAANRAMNRRVEIIFRAERL